MLKVISLVGSRVEQLVVAHQFLQRLKLVFKDNTNTRLAALQPGTKEEEKITPNGAQSEIKPEIW